MKPRKSILDPTFEYTSADRTDIRKRFREMEKMRQQQREEVTAQLIPIRDIFDKRRGGK